MIDNQKISILIIEDNAGDQLLLYENLKSTGLLLDDVVMVETLEEGLVQLANKNFTVLFLDLFLPDSEGLASVSELITLNSKLPIIIYSGLSDTQIALKAITLGAQDFLIKGDYTNSLLEKTVRYSIERKSNLDALQESIERYNLVSKATHDMVWDWDLTTDEVFRNPDGWRKIFKTKEGHEVGTREDWPSRVHPDDREEVQNGIEKAIATTTQDLFEFEFKVIRDDDTLGYIEDRGYIIRNTDGKAVRIIGASHDITERKKAEQKVALSEQRFRSLVQNSSDLLAILDGEGNYVYVSPTSKIILGYDPDYFTGKSAFSFMHEDDVKKTMDSLAQVNSQNFIEVPLFRFKNASGEWRWIESTISNRMDDPAIHGIVVNSRDVTERKIANDEIEKLSIIAKETVNGIIISDADQNIVWVNNGFTKLFGYELDEVIGKNPGDFLPGPETDKEVHAYVQSQKKNSKEPFTFEMLAYGKTGNKRYLSVLVQPIFDENGNLKQSFAMQTDITEKKHAEDEVKKLSLIAQETINGVVLVDTKLNVLWINNAFTKITGYILEEVIGRSPLEFFSGPGTDKDMILYIKEEIKKKKYFTFEKLNYKKGGEIVFMRVQMQPVFDKNGEVEHFFALFTDITVEKELEEKVELEKRLKQKEITEAVYTAQENERSEIGRELHDNVNQLLGATKLYIDMARTNEVSRDEMLTSASGYTLNAIEEIRKLSKTLITPLIKEIGLLDSVKDLMNELMLVHPIQIILTTDKFLEDNLDEKFKLNIFRIVQEQINNILKHAKATTINISMEDNYGKLLIMIKDDGVGFDTTKRKAGVGISNIKTRCGLFNGSVLLASQVGKGTTLCLTFNKSALLQLNTYEE